MTARDAFTYAITQYLRNDATLMGVSNGAFYQRAGDETPLPYTLWSFHNSQRHLMLEDEAYRDVWFWVKAAWGDANGANYVNGSAIDSRLYYLFDGARRADRQRITTALNAYLNPNGWKMGSCVEQTTIPPDEEFIGEDKTTPRYTMGYLFHATIERFA